LIKKSYSLGHMAKYIFCSDSCSSYLDTGIRMTQIFHEVSAFTPFLFILPVTNKIADLIRYFNLCWSTNFSLYPKVGKLPSLYLKNYSTLSQKKKLFHTHMEGDFYINVVLGSWHGWSFPLIHKTIYISCSVKKCRKYLSSDAQALNHSVS